MLNYLWLGLILCGVSLGVLTGRTEAVTSATFDAAKASLMTIALPLGAAAPQSPALFRGAPVPETPRLGRAPDTRRNQY